MAKKIDNHDLRAKLELRRHFLRKYHGDGSPIHVLDCCQGDGLLWKQLRKEFPVASHWGPDLKTKKGRLKLDSVRVLGQSGWPQNVIDIDTYGSPWKHWSAMLPNVVRPITVFMTDGFGRQQQSALDRYVFLCVGLLPLYPKLPAMFRRLFIFRDFYLAGCIAKSGLSIIEAVEAVSTADTRYIGVRLEPA